MNLTKLSTRRLIVSGSVVELYEYARPYAFNYAPLRSSGGSSDGTDRVQERRQDNLSHVRSQIRRLVECNYASYGYAPIFFTFTFKENITSVGVANKYFHDFIKRFNRAIGRKAKYLSIIEFQKRGAVHYHCIFFNVSLDIEERERRERFVARLWSHGFVDIERVRSARAVAPYVCKYLDKGIHDVRLRGRKAYFTSRALLRPLEFRNEARIDKVLESLSLKVTRVERYESNYLGSVKYTQYYARG